MNTHNRREFLKKAVVGACGIALAGCTSNKPAVPTALPATAIPPVPTQPATSIPASPVPPTVAAPTKAGQPTNTAVAPTKPAATQPPASGGNTTFLSVARGGEPEEMVRRAVKALGGMEQFVPKGARVIVKPNLGPGLLKPEFASMTNPFVVGAVVKLCFEAGAGSVEVMDNTFGGRGPDFAYKVSGIDEQTKAAGGKIVLMAPFKYKETNLPKAKKLKSVDFYDEILKQDVVLINVPIAKHHGSAGLTISMKNLMGIINDRNDVHAAGLAQGIADLNTYLRPKLTIVDAVRILMHNGPGGGNLNDVKKTDTILAGTDVVALDKYVTDNLFGLKTKDSDYPRYVDIAASMGLGNADLNTMKIEEIRVGG